MRREKWQTDSPGGCVVTLLTRGDEGFYQKSGLEFLHHLDFLSFFSFHSKKLNLSYFACLLVFKIWFHVIRYQTWSVPCVMVPLICFLSSPLLSPNTIHVFECSDLPLTV